MWMIINIDQLFEHHKAVGRFIPEKQRPTVLYDDKEVAEAEIVRLGFTHPGCEFILFEAVGKTTWNSDNMVVHLEPITGGGE